MRSASPVRPTSGRGLTQNPFPGPSETRPSLLPKVAVKPWVQASPPGATLFLNAQVVDPAAGSLLKGLQNVLVRKGLFEKVFSTDSGCEVDLEGVKRVDLKGKFLCPGLIDAHVHCTAVPGVKDVSQLFFATPDQTVHLRTTYVLKEMILRGFTTVRDTGGASKPLAQAIEEGLIEGPRLFQCGKALSQTGGHGDFAPAIKSQGSSSSSAGCCGGHSLALGRVVDGVPEILRATREELKAGADFIKIMVGGGVLSETDSIESVQYSAEEIRAVTDTCRQMGGKLVTAHAYTVEAINHAVSNGVGGIEHGNLIDAETARMMASKNIYLTPTLSCYGIMVRPPFQDFLPDEGKAKNLQVMKQGLQALKLAEENGVCVCYGSDLLISMHALQLEEFTVRAEVLPSPTILRHATTNPAKMLGKAGKLGTISEGAIADVLVLEENPLLDITVLDRPENNLLVVMKEGRVVSSRLEGLQV